MDTMLTTIEAAEALGLRPCTVIYHLKTGNLVGKQFARDWMVDPESVASLQYARAQARARGQRRHRRTKAEIQRKGGK